MALKLFMDHNVPRAITDALRERRVEVLTAFDDGSHELSDPDLLNRATAQPNFPEFFLQTTLISWPKLSDDNRAANFLPG